MQDVDAAHTLISSQFWYYHSVPIKRPWALKHKSRYWPTWVLIRDKISIHLYRSCYLDPLNCGTWALTREWASLAWDTTVQGVRTI